MKIDKQLTISWRTQVWMLKLERKHGEKKWGKKNLNGQIKKWNVQMKKNMGKKITT